MSVDLVGSTAFKSKYHDKRDPNEPYPIWLNRTRNFYRLFPKMLAGHFKDVLAVIEDSESFKDAPPQVWKTVGDEIIFCIRVRALEHLAACARAFVKTLASYGNSIHALEPELDVKGCAWIASFPAPNATIVSATQLTSSDISRNISRELYEADEAEADSQPSKYDFLGKQIDTGFRISKFAQSHELALSVDLAWLLTVLKQRDLVDFNFTFRGREALKGVIGGVPYPIITIQTERSVKRRELDALERTAMGTGFSEPVGLRNYLYSFMDHNNIEVPIIPAVNEGYNTAGLPVCYVKLQKAWNICKIEIENRDKHRDGSEAAPDENQSGSETAVTEEKIIQSLDLIVEGFNAEDGQ